ncbi:MAG: PKD domain-containing protein [Candidatus Methylarchaceae archaeon HK02M2]|nr:PKD domain-containing protein [Candidatus Methylarchaceae archaeon HK02M2]
MIRFLHISFPISKITMISNRNFSIAIIRNNTRMEKALALLTMSLLFVLAIGLTCIPNALAYSVGDDGQPVHEYIAFAALSLYSNGEINDYFGQIYSGAGHEDLTDHVYDWSPVTYTHFWDVDKGINDPVDSSPFVEDAENAWQKAQVLWGMALGEYAYGKALGEYGYGHINRAYEYLGHIAHLLADMTVPAHAHEDMHWPDDDCYEDWMTYGHAMLSQSELDWLSSMGKFEIPEDTFDPLFYLFYTANQIGDFFPSDDYDGDTNDYWGGWMDEIYSELGMDSITKPRYAYHLDDNDAGDNNDDGDLGVIRENCLLHAIRATAALYELFYETVSQNSALTVVINHIYALDYHDPFWGNADFYVRVYINGFRFINEGNQVIDNNDIYPGWAFARYVGLSGSAEIKIQVWDEDEAPNDDDQSDINPEGGRDLVLTINLANGAISGDLEGACGDVLTSAGTEEDSSQIWFRILMPSIPPTVNAGPDQTVDEGDLVSLEGSFTDPNTEDIHTAVWDWGDGSPAESGTVVESDGAGTVTGTHAYGDNGEYTVTLTVTDDDGAQGTDTLTVMVNNVAPTATIDAMDQPNPHFVLPIVHTLTFTGSFTDPGWLDTHTTTWNFGDGTVVSGTLNEENVQPDATGTTTASHVYSEPGTYTVTLTVTDDDGGVGTDIMEVIVASAEEAPEIINEYIQNLPDEVFKNNPSQRKKALSNMLSAINDMIVDEEWNGAIKDLRNNMREKSDGFIDGRLNNDWIIDQAVQQEVCMMIDDLVAYLETFL